MEKEKNTTPCNDETPMKDSTMNESLQPLFQELIKHAQSNISKSSAKAKPSEKVMTKAEAEKYIDKTNEKWNAELMKDAQSKRKFRTFILVAVFILLGVQIVFLNYVILKVFDAAVSVNPETNLPVVQHQTIETIIGMLKWYTTAIITELLTTLIFIVKAVFETPKKPT